MDFRSVCTMHGGSALAGGAALILVPGPLLSLFALADVDATLLLARMFGGVLIALGGTLFAARDLAEPVARRWLLVANAVCDLAITGAAVAAVLAGTTGSLGWLLVGLFGINALSWLVILPRG